MRARLIRPPALRTGDAERASSWLELLFDLVFVIAVTQVGLALHGNLSAPGFVRLAVLFVPIWWAWVGYTNYADRFDSDDVVFRLLVLAAMLGMSVVAVAIPDTFHHRSQVFAVAYAAVRALLIVLYLRARRHVPAARPLCDATISVFVVGTALWLGSLAVPEPWRFLVWAAALLIEGATPWLARRAMAAVPYHASHLPERYGLFTLIVLGESLAAVVFGVRGGDWRAGSMTTAVLGFGCAAALWWLYFDGVDRAAVGRGLLARNTFIYGHLIVALGLTLFGVGIKEAILASDGGDLPAGGWWALCAGPAMMLVALALVRQAARQPGAGRAPLVESAAAVLLLAVGAIGGHLSPELLTGTVTALLVATVATNLLTAQAEAA
ncbi:low temperature requirement protein A [Solihabitans fulvus]|uniref:low temperature requirement protein A n=1 Tax=Solihabitans fulvus TaxID=1892852 RepID=UPI001661E090|nr:low temperature requirement protein A [Solihabitans fulvus]